MLWIWFNIIMDLNKIPKSLNNPVLADEIVRAKELLEGVNEADQTQTIIEFFSMVIHEVKNPLAAIRTMHESFFLELESDLRDRPEVIVYAKEYSDRILSEIDRLNNLLSSAKHFSQPEKARWELVNVVCLIDEINDIYSPLFKKLDIEFRISSNAQFIDFFCSKDEIIQLIINLLENSKNAILISNNKLRKITLEILLHKSYFFIIIRDTGCGLNKDEIKEIFKPSRTKRKHGLGLAVCRVIAQRYKGRIFIHSLKGQGSTFALVLPLNQSQCK
ncbi:MAG: HAMP domain-containing histidine kinase [Candidatus Coatesbacteria bacterium]|nr:HAMP domain-containing histidine kinase [Candidatus Coatesbacteria bacterium]